MMQITGVIESIETKIAKNFEKEVVWLKMNEGQSAFVQFNSKAARMQLEFFKVNDPVCVAVRLEAKLSYSGTPHNNLIAQSIIRL